MRIPKSVLGLAMCVAPTLTLAAPKIVPGQLLVKTRSGTVPPLVRMALSAREVSSPAGEGVRKLFFSGSVDNALSLLRANPDVVFAEPIYIGYKKATTNDPMLPSDGQYGIRQVRAPQAWDLFTGNASMVIAVLDSGIRSSHEDLRTKITGVFNAADGSNNVNDTDGHGTHCSGIAAAATNNGVGVAAVGYNCRLLAIKVSGPGFFVTSETSAIGMRTAADRGAKIISMSYGITAPSQIESSAATYAWQKGCLLLAAAGNENTNDPAIIGWPSLYPEVINVGATNITDGKAGFSNFGPEVDIAGPGDKVLSTVFDGDQMYQDYSGTSMACPFVASVAGLIWSRNPVLPNSRIRDVLYNTSDPVGSWVVRGRVNAFRAIQQVSPLERLVSTPVEVRVGRSAGVVEGTLISSFSSAALAAASVSAKDSQQYRIRSIENSSIGQVASIESVLKVTQPSRLIRQLNLETSTTLPTTASGIVFVHDYTTQRWTQVGTIAGGGAERDGSVTISRDLFSKVINSSGHIRVYIRAVQPRRIRSTQFMFDINRVSAVGFFDPTGNP